MPVCVEFIDRSIGGDTYTPQSNLNKCDSSKSDN